MSAEKDTLSMLTPAPSSPDGNDVGEQEQKADDLQVPAAGEVLQGHHDQRHHHQRTEQDLGEAVYLQVKQANLGDRVQGAEDRSAAHSPGGKRVSTRAPRPLPSEA